MAGTPQDSGISLQTVTELGPSIPLFGVCMGLQCIGEAFGGLYMKKVVHLIIIFININCVLIFSLQKCILMVCCIFLGKVVRSPYGVVHGKGSLVHYDEKLDGTLFSGLPK